MTTSDAPAATTDGRSSTTPTSTAGMDPMGAATRPPDEQGCVCTAKTGCPEYREDNPCAACREIGFYDPCPTLGFGCGLSATEDTPRCDCCSDAEWAAASWSPEDSA